METMVKLGNRRLDLPSRVLVVASLPLLILIVGAWSHRWVAEDAFINFRIVQQTLAGHPFSFNESERVEAGTSPLWITVLTALQISLGWLVSLPWLAAFTGLALTLAGMAAAMAGALRLIRARGHEGLVLPAGMLVLAVLPPMWDFATSGLETGLTFAWLGTCFWGLCRTGLRPPGDHDAAPPAWLAVLIGLGALTRPDLLLFTATFFAALVWLSPPGWRAKLRIVAAAAAVPVAFEIFRMAYFAALVPNTALAKEAGQARWLTGWYYAVDLLGTYRLVIPLAMLGVWAGLSVVWYQRDAGRDIDRVVLVLVGAPIVGALAHAVYVVRVGGDFMHGRMLLPALFGLLMPVAMLAVPVRLTRRRTVFGIAATLVGWAALSGLILRPPYSGPVIDGGIADERSFWDAASGHENSITIDDHANLPGVIRARRARALAEQERDVLLMDDGRMIELAEGRGVVLETRTIGLESVAAGLDVEVSDSVGLASPLGSRLTGFAGETRVGHEKHLPASWVIAREAPESPSAGFAYDAASPTEDREVAAVRQLLRCPQVTELEEAVSGDLTLGRLVSNFFHAVALTRLRIAIDRDEAAPCAAPN
jgi:arabinofuranosyltransferase